MSETEPPSNPYAAPQTPLARSAADRHSWFGRIVSEWQRGAWPLVFMLNLVLPGLLGFQLCNNPGRVGMILATVVLLLLTAWIVAGNPLLRARLIAGGKIVAVFQFLPFFHLLIGYCSLRVLEYSTLLRFSIWRDEDRFFLTANFWAAVLLTTMVGSGLLLLAFLLGIRQVSRAEEKNWRAELWKSPDSNF